MKLIFSVLFSILAVQSTAQVDLTAFTVGFGIGPHISFGEIKEYSLSTDAEHRLQIDDKSSAGLAISTVITMRLGKVATVSYSDQLLSQSKIATAARGAAAYSVRANRISDEADPNDRWAISLAINLADLNTEGLAFNKFIDGGIGLGYYVNSNFQIAGFIDFQGVRQLRASVLDSYEGKSIPKGGELYTALDPDDKDLFTTKTFLGCSVKFIFTLKATKQ